jgi:hypothetical protein
MFAGTHLSPDACVYVGLHELKTSIQAFCMVVIPCRYGSGVTAVLLVASLAMLRSVISLSSQSHLVVVHAQMCVVAPVQAGSFGAHTLSIAGLHVYPGNADGFNQTVDMMQAWSLECSPMLDGRAIPFAP